MMHALAQLVRVISGLWTFYFAVYSLFYLTLPASAAASIPKERGLLLWPTARPGRLCHNGARACKRNITPTSLVSHISPFSYAGCSHAVFYCRHIYKTFHARPNSVQTACSFRRWMCVFRHLKVLFHLAHFLLYAHAADRALRAHGSSTGWFFSSPF